MSISCVVNPMFLSIPLTWHVPLIVRYNVNLKSATTAIKSNNNVDPTLHKSPSLLIHLTPLMARSMQKRRRGAPCWIVSAAPPVQTSALNFTKTGTLVLSMPTRCFIKPFRHWYFTTTTERSTERRKRQYFCISHRDKSLYFLKVQAPCSGLTLVQTIAMLRVS